MTATVGQDGGLEDSRADQLATDLKVWENCKMKGAVEENEGKEVGVEVQLHFEPSIFSSCLTKSFENYKLLENIVLILVRSAH